MGDVATLQRLAFGGQNSDPLVLSVVAPSASDRSSRSSHLDLTRPGHQLSNAYQATSIMLPSQAPWRNDFGTSTSIGNPLHSTAGQKVLSNHFKVDATRLATSTVSQYSVHLYRLDGEGKPLLDREKSISLDCAGDEDSRITTIVVMTLRDLHPEWNIGNGTGFTYNLRSIAYTSRPLPLPDLDVHGQPFLSELVSLKNLDGSDSNKKYRVTLTLASTISFPPSTASAWSALSTPETLLALDTPLLSFARWGVASDSPPWFIVGSRAFRSNTSGGSASVKISPIYTCTRGYYVGLKTCMAGLVLVTDMVVSVFLAGGDMISLMVASGGYQNVTDLCADAARGIHPGRLRQMNEAIKGAKTKTTHLGHIKKCKGLGPASNSPESEFEFEGTNVTVAKYFEKKAKVSGSSYRIALPNGALKYPSLPCIKFGSAAKAHFIPPELILVQHGQSRARVCAANPEFTAQVIKHAAARPDERFRFLTESAGGGGSNPFEKSVVSVLREDGTARDFGVSEIGAHPMEAMSVILPPARIKYADPSPVNPGLSGGWDMGRGSKFAILPRDSSMQGVGARFATLIVGGNAPPVPAERQAIAALVQTLVGDAASTGIKLVNVIPAGQDAPSCPATNVKIRDNLHALIVQQRVRLVVVVMMQTDRIYGEIKLEADKLGISTQCVKYTKIARGVPRGYTANIMLKINTKLGGVNHTLASRIASTSAARPTTGQRLFQDPPASLSWLFDKPCMLVGIDVSHGETSSSTESVAAVVASMDGRAGHYAGYVSMQSMNQEMVAGLEDAMVSLLATFKGKNEGKMPETILVYRDGVSEGQFDQVTTVEVDAVRGAIALMGSLEGAIKIAVVVCQKGHNTRLFYEEVVDGHKIYINPCPGLCVDASGRENSITHGRLNEFYLNSHVAIQGTAKPCKYTLVYDEIGFKVRELELLTYWLTYLYCRANKSVSYASPAYYAHWLSKRGKHLSNAGGTRQDLLDISTLWGAQGRASNMFFI